MQVVQNFLGNHRAENYAELVDNMLKSYQLMSARLSLKRQFLHSLVDFFPLNRDDSDERGERFNQDTKVIEN